jgi:formylmethanofuran dehydrogenase subunit A
LRAKLSGGRIYDPAQGLAGTVRDIFVEDGRIAADPGPGAVVDQSYDLGGKIVMPGAIDIHTHVAGGNVNSARLLLPEQHRASMERRLAAPFGNAKWSTWETGYRYARMGYTTVVEPAVLPVNALQAHLEMADIPIVDKAGLAVLGSDDLLLGLLRDARPQAEINDYVAWTLEATQCLGIKLINAGGANAFKSNLRKLDLDDEVPEYGVSSRRILHALQHAVCELDIPHPLHLHCNNLGVAGNVETALATVEAAEGRPLHLAHIQFYGYGKEGKRGFSSGAARIAEAIDANPNVTADIGQVLFGHTVTVSGDSMRQFDARTMARPRKWVSWDAECEGGGGIVPYRYSHKSFVNTLQWAIGLEIFLLAQDPGRIFFTTDHPNGAPFTRYPELFALLMDRDYRESWFERVNPQALGMTLLPELDREYSFTDIAVMTRTAPAALLGLADRGHLRCGAVADISVYTPQKDVASMFSAASLVFKNGELVVREGDIVASPMGMTHTVRPQYDRGIERTVKAHFDRFYSLGLENFKVTEELFSKDCGCTLVRHAVD